MAAQIRALAAPPSLRVLLGALAGAPRMRVDTHVTPTREWLKILQHVIASGDVVI